MDPSSFASLLRQHRLHRGLTQEQLAEHARVSARAVSDLERGLKRARASTVRQLSTALALSAEDAAALVRAGLPHNPGDEPAGDSPARRQHLPCQLSSFIGRTSELAELDQFLERSCLLTLVGPGGVGKTRLALEAAQRFAPSVRDGVHLVQLASLTDPGLVVERVAGTLGIIERTKGSLVANLINILVHRQMLLVLDNCEHVLDACARLVETLLQASPHVRVLATSRERLGVRGEQVWLVPPLSIDDATPEAMQLFSERAAAIVPSFSLTDSNRGSVIDICRHLDGIPLAIELAATRVQTLTPAQIADRLDDCLQLLVGGSRTADPRQQTLQATLTWSYDLLDAADRMLFDRLAVFSGGWDLEAAEAVCAARQLGSEPVMNGLARLVDRSLVQVEHGRYRLLETVREYAWDRQRLSDGVEPLRERHALHYLHLAETAAPQLKQKDQAVWLERIATEHDNLRAALRWSIDADRPEIGLRIANALARFWEVRGHLSEARRWLSDLLAVPMTRSDPLSVRAAAVAHSGFFAAVQGDRLAAQPLLRRGLTLARAANEPAVASFALHGLGELALERGEHAVAREVLDEGLALAREIGDAWATARILSNLGSLARQEGDLWQARGLMEEGLAIARAAGERRIESTLQVNLAIVAMDASDFAAAAAFLEASLATKHELRDSYGAALAHRTFGWVAFWIGDYRAACDHFRKVLAIVRGLGFLEAEPTVLIGLGCIAAQLGDGERALRLFAAEARAAGMIAKQGPPMMYTPPGFERQRPFIDAARQQVGNAAERLWSAGWRLDQEAIQSEAAAIDQAAANSVHDIDG